jgi:signal transduction histidine kinase/CheY-like chemotaxis protein
MTRRRWHRRGRPPYLPLSRRFALWMSSLIVGLLLVLGSTETYFGYRESLERIEQLQEVLAASAARELGTYMGDIQSTVRDVAKLPWGHPGFGPAERRQEFYRKMQLVPAITDLQAVDAQGREQLFVSRLQPDRIDSGLPPEEPALLAASPGGAIRLGQTFFRQHGLPGIRMAASDGQGAVIATVDLRLLGDIVKRAQASDGMLAYIVDAQGTLIAHPRATHVLARLDLSGSDAFQQALRGRGLQPTLLRGFATTDLAGQPVIVTAAQIPGTDWMVFMEQQRSAALQHAWATLTRTLVVMALGAVAAVIAGIAFARRMAAPIVALRKATSRIAAGDLSATVSARRNDEIADLANDFNAMVQRLSALYASLEAKVAERTAELSQRQQEAERANAAKTRFLAAASHDLRQPMHSISLLVGVLRGRLNESAQTELADKVQSSVTTMENLFGNLLDISKLDAGAVHAHIEDVDLGWLLARAAHTWAPQAQEKGLDLRVRPGRWMVRGDPTLLERIVANLLANAIRYTRRGGVLVGCRRRGNRCELQVWDTGPGIAEEHREAVFEEFFRIGTPGSGQEKGLGLGLSIVRRCVQLLGCSIAVHSREGQGSVFKVTMPLAASALAPSAAGGASDQPLPMLDGNFIVVVDDEATNRDAVRDALLAAGCHVVTAANGDEALAQLQAHLRSPDLILTDFRLGDSGNGLDVIRRLRAHYDEPIAALIVTADTDASLLSEAAALGAGLLHKPAGLQRLMAALKASLGSLA